MSEAIDRPLLPAIPGAKQTGWYVSFCVVPFDAVCAKWSVLPSVSCQTCMYSKHLASRHTPADGWAAVKVHGAVSGVRSEEEIGVEGVWAALPA